MEDNKAKPVGTAVELKTGFLIEGKGAVKDVVMREMVGYDQDLLMNPKIKPMVKMNQILGNCIQSIGDETDRVTIRNMTKKMVGTDRALALIALRAVSLGHDYEYLSMCPSCGKKDKKIFDLRQITIVNPPSADRLFYEVSLPSGAKARMKVADADTDEFIEARSDGTNGQTIAIFARTSELNGSPATIDQIQSLKMKDVAALNKERRTNEGYLDDEILVSCVACKHEYKDSFEMDPQSFFGL